MLSHLDTYHMRNKDILTRVGSVALIIGGVAGIVESYQEAVHKPYGYMTKQEVSEALFPLSVLTTAEKTFIENYLTPYLTKETFRDILTIAEHSQSINLTSKIKTVLVFVGVPIYSVNGGMFKFIPKKISYGVPNPSEKVSGNSDVLVPSLEAQLLHVALGTNMNSIGSEMPYSGDPRLHVNFGENKIPAIVPHYAINADDTLVSADREDFPSKDILTDDQFARELRKAYQEHDFCSILPHHIAPYRQGVHEFKYSYVSPVTGEKWTLNICDNTLKTQPEFSPLSKSISGETVEFNLNTFPPEMRQYVEGLFNQPFPWVYDTDTRQLKATVQTTKETLVLFKDTNPGEMSTVLGFRDSQLQDKLAPEYDPAYLFRYALGILGIAVGTLAGGASLLRKQPEEVGEAERKRQERLQRRAMYGAPKPTQEESVSQPAVIKGYEPEPIIETIPTLTWTYGEEKAVISDMDVKTFRKVALENVIHIVSENEETAAQRQRDIERITVSGKEVAELFVKITKVEGNFTQLQTFLKENISKRITIDQVGGDTIALSYQVINPQGNAKEVLGHLYIHFDLKERNLEAVYFPGSLPVIEQKIKRAEETPFQETIAGQEIDTVKQAADLITGKIVDLLSSQYLDEAKFNVLRQACREVIAQHRAYSLVKDEVIRQLITHLKDPKGGIEIQSENEHIYNIRSNYFNTIADRIYDYMNDTRTGEQEYNAFTNNAKNTIDDLGLKPLKRTAAKVWETRTGYRVQIVQATKENTKRIVILFTDNDH